MSDQAPAASKSPCAGGILRGVLSGATKASTDRATVRERAVTVDVEQLLAMPGRLTLNLFDDVCLVAVKRAGPVEPSPIPVWTGAIEGAPNSHVTIVVNAGVVAASVVNPPQSYRVELMKGNVHRVREVDQSKYPNEHPPLTPPPKPSLPPKEKP